MKDNISLYEVFKEVALSNQNIIAYTQNGNRITYKALLKKVDEVSSSFSVLGVKKKDYVSVSLFNSLELITVIYALNKIGAICNLINPLYSEEEFKYSLEITKSKIIVLSSTSYKKVLRIKDSTSLDTIIKIEETDSISKLNKIKQILFNDIKDLNDNLSISFNKFLGLSKQNNEENIIKNDIAVVLYSGSSSGKLRGILLSNKNINSFVKNINITNNNDVVINTMPIFSGFGIGLMHYIFSNALEGVYSDNKKEDETIIKYKPNLILLSPNILNNLLNSKKIKSKDLSFINKIICMGDILSKDEAKKVNNFLYEHNSNALIDNMYGLNESTSGVTLTNSENDNLGSIGFPIDNTIIKIFDSKTNKFLGPNIVGEICISGPTVMVGYLNDTELTNKKLVKYEDNIYLHTEDEGYIDEDGRVYFESKMNEVIVSNGYKIYKRHIEEIIMSHPYVEKCVVIGLPHPYKKEVVKAYIVLKKGLVLNSDIKRSIRSFCEKSISSYALPYAYGYRKEIPQNISGKVSYEELINDKDEEI